ncbi:hypothetical protein D3C78_1185310 [compost metagenome]
MQMLRVKLVAQHLGGQLTMRGERAQPAEDRVLQAFARAEEVPARRLRRCQQGSIGTLEPGFDDRVLACEVPGDVGQTDVQSRRDVVEVNLVPAALCTEGQRGVDDPASELGLAEDAGGSHFAHRIVSATRVPNSLLKSRCAGARRCAAQRSAARR